MWAQLSAGVVPGRFLPSSGKQKKAGVCRTRHEMLGDFALHSVKTERLTKIRHTSETGEQRTTCRSLPHVSMLPDTLAYDGCSPGWGANG
ncbi:MAG TPA: hypothetical protein VNG51_21540 [Ktedonobacteraceae bacterium]|nr:hypothetical protein [Ktedonobacteraceae bacterium]